MNTVLTDLYNFLKPEFQTEEERIILARNRKQIERIEQLLSEKDISAFMEIQTELSMCREENAFFLGFQLATQILTASWR